VENVEKLFGGVLSVMEVVFGPEREGHAVSNSTKINTKDQNIVV
jgi:hypothetical protein